MARKRRVRIPKLSDKPEGHTGRYYTSLRGPTGKPKRVRFAKDRRESEKLYRRWVVEKYDDDAKIIIGNQPSSSDKPDQDTSLWHIANEYLDHEELRVRPDGSPRKRGTIDILTFHDNSQQVRNIVAWCKQRFGKRVAQASFANLITPTAYEAMMLDFVGRMSDSCVNKHRQRFWALARFARRAPRRVMLGFGPEDVRRFGGTVSQKQRQIPSVATIRKILQAATCEERLWVWMAIGLGFGQDDLARSRPIYFDAETYDMRRGKTGFERYGVMHPIVWAHLQCYLAETPRDPEGLLFITRNGNPLVWKRTKTADELRNGTTTHGPTKLPYKRTDNVAHRWKALLKRAEVKGWKEGFSVWRRLGCTAYGSRPRIGLSEIRTFMGHGATQAADNYLKPLSPEVKTVVKWINRMLDCDDAGAWRS